MDTAMHFSYLFLLGSVFSIKPVRDNLCHIVVNESTYTSEWWLPLNYDCSALICEFVGSEYVFNFSLEFANKSSVNLTGLYGTTKLTFNTGKVTAFNFSNVNEVYIKNLDIISEEHKLPLLESKGLISILTSVSILLDNVALNNSKGYGFLIRDFVNATIMHSRVQNNYGGIYLCTKTGDQSYITLDGDTFAGNSNNSIYIVEKGVKLVIKNCAFEGNQGIVGGGLHVSFLEVSGVEMRIESSTFKGNQAQSRGGGLSIYVIVMREKSSPKFSLILKSTIFLNNTSKYGGGFYFYLMATAELSPNTTIENCTWKGNEASYDAAITLYVSFKRDKRPVTTFKNCTFYNNTISSMYNSRTIHQYEMSRSSLMSEGHDLIFDRHINFSSNTGTALCLILSTLILANNSRISFYENHGDYGGALALYASNIKFNQNTNVNFTGNKANHLGGAVYISKSNSTKTECQFSAGEVSDGAYPILQFSENTVSRDNCMHYGRSIYMHSVNICQYDIVSFKNVTTFRFNSDVHLIFKNSSYKDEISTAVSLKYSEQCIMPTLKFIPGKGRSLPIMVQNEFKIRMENLIQVSIGHADDIELTNSSRFILQNDNITLQGNTCSNDTLNLSLIQYEYSNIIQFQVILIPCPPGYILKNKSCTCPRKNYIGIAKCFKEEFQASIARLYWMGYNESDMNSTEYGHEDNLHSCVCPRGYCHNNKELNNLIILPSTSNMTDLDNLMCGPNRTGFLCAKCKENHSVFFHSDSFKCKLDKFCSLGLIFFLLSEVVPVTILFTFIITFDIQLTSGSVQGFILYVQIFETLWITAHHQITLNNATFTALKVLQATYRMLNLEFFTDDTLSFCLWKGASSLNIISIKYITIGYSLLLVMAVMFIWNKCSSQIRICSRKSTASSVIHGLSSFLVICYFQIVKVSLQLLTPGTVYGKNGTYEYQVAFYDGSLKFLVGNHLAYAIPVILLASPLIILPPLLLLVYPLCYKVFSMLHIQESWFTYRVCKIFPLERFKPFFDSFQSCFKDQYRYFAGLYFLYRFVTLVTFTITRSLPMYYATVQVQLIIMFLFHTWTQPYKNKWHNKLDAYIFATLAIINFLTLFNLHGSLQLGEPTENIPLTSVIQIALGYLPLAVILSQCVWGKRSLLKKALLKAFKPKNILFSNKKDDGEILFNLQEDREMSANYVKA